eukprot:gene1474-1712_t
MILKRLKRLLSSKKKVPYSVLVAANKKKGIGFEKTVADILEKRMEFGVKRNVILTDKYGNKSEIDIVYGYFSKTYVECKNYLGPVPLSDVAKFKEVLALNNISLSKGLFITSSTYVPRATTIGR